MDWLRRALAVSALMGMLGCGSINYINQVTRRASVDVDAARAAQAETHAPYWFTLAVEYLRKAREEAAEADFQDANRLGRKASEAARKAIEISLASRQGGSGAPPESKR